MNQIFYRLLMVVLFGVIWLSYAVMSGDDEPIYVMLLFATAAAPGLIHVIWFPEDSSIGRRIGGPLLASGVVLGMLWLVYGLSSNRPLPSGMNGLAQWAALGWALVLTGFSLHITTLLLARPLPGRGAEPPDGRPPDGPPPPPAGLRSRAMAYLQDPTARDEIRTRPILTTSGLFATVLHVTLALAISLAFHDRQEQGLYVNPLGESHEIGEITLQNCQFSADLGKNKQALERLRDSIVRAPGRQHLRLAIEGAVDSQPFVAEGPVPAAVASYRADCVESVIHGLGAELRTSSGQEVEWLFATSVRPHALNGAVAPGPLPGALQSVHVRATYTGGSSRRPQLLDYVYFLAYTIVTTGYGDLVPVSPFAKFLCTLANFLELFFSAIFFGVFLSFIAGLGGGVQR